MTERDHLILKEFKERLSEVVELIDMKVFGSIARGEAVEDSDLDVFIEVERLDKESEEKIHEIAWEVGFKHSVFISPLTFTRYEIEESPLRSAPIVKNINEEGVRI